MFQFFFVPLLPNIETKLLATKYVMRFGIIAILLTLVLPLSADEFNLESLYAEIDACIEHSPKYVAAHESKIREAKDVLAREWSTEKRLYQLMHIYELYRAFDNDSALHYIECYIDEAQKAGRIQDVYQGKIKEAFQCSTVGLYTESIGLLRSIDSKDLNKDLLTDYYIACMHVCGELSFYTRLSSAHDEYGKMRDEYRDSVFMTGNRASEDYLLRFEVKLTEDQRYNEALKVNDQRMKMVKEGTHEYAIVSYYRYIIFLYMNKIPEAKYWLCQSALSDVKNAVMDQASLLALAELLNGEGDLERSYRYIQFTWECNNRFNTRMRSWQISPILTVIENNYQHSMEHSRRVLVGSVIAVSVLAFLLLGVLFFLHRRNKQLASARNALHETNDRLAALNSELQHANSQLSATNDQFAVLNSKLKEANSVKDEYIGRFLSLCSQYVDKLDNYRKMVNKKMKNKELEELYRITKSSELKEAEIEELNQNFDSVFLHLFPNFIDDFNALLAPEFQITPKEENRLTTDLRIFALIRLGIDDSSKIAEFLHYSVNTVYNYRARIKNGAIGNREAFERQVKELGKVK